MTNRAIPPQPRRLPRPPPRTAPVAPRRVVLRAAQALFTAEGLLTLAWTSPRAAGAAQAPPAPGDDPRALARALTGAWNAGQVERVVALFAEDAVVRQTGVGLTPYAVTAAVTADDVYGTAMFLPDSAPRESEGTVVWATGRAGVRTWVADLVRRHHTAEARGYRLTEPAGDRVQWEYRVFVDPYRQYRDVPPTEGTAELHIRAGEIVALILTSTRASIQRRDEAMLTAAAADTHRRAVTRDAASAPTGAPTAATERRAAGRVTAEVATPAALCITGSGALAAAVVGARQLGRRGSSTDHAQRTDLLRVDRVPTAIGLPPSGAATSDSAPTGTPRENT